jgi:hypothetical protein
MESQSVALEFSGCPSRTSGLTWFQRAYWDYMREQAPYGAHLNIATVLDISSAINIRQVLDGICSLLYHHDALRTIYSLNKAGNPFQEVISAGRLSVTLRDVGCDDPDTVAWSEVGSLSRRPFTSTELPIRASLVVRDDRPLRLAFSFHHLSVDEWATNIIAEDLKSTLGVRRQERTESTPSSSHIVDRVIFESTPEGQRQTRRALYYWEQELFILPNEQFPKRLCAPETPRYIEAILKSPAVDAAVRILGRRYGTGQPSVLMGAFAAILTVFTGGTVSYFNVLSANRFTRSERRAICGFSQYVPMHVALDEAMFADVVYRVWRQSLLAYRHGQYDPLPLAETMEGIKVRRGSNFDLGCTFNFAQQPVSASSADFTATSPQEILKLVGKSEVGSRGRSDRMNIALNLTVRPTGRDMTLYLCGDTALFPSALLQDVLLRMESLLIEAVSDEHLSMKNIRELFHDLILPPDPNLIRAGQSWIDFSACEELIESALLPQALGLFVIPGEETEHTLQAYFVPQDISLSPTAAHRACLAALGERRHTIAPTWYGICRGSPRITSDRDEWRRYVVRSGTGRELDIDHGA